MTNLEKYPPKHHHPHHEDTTYFRMCNAAFSKGFFQPAAAFEAASRLKVSREAQLVSGSRRTEVSAAAWRAEMVHPELWWLMFFFSLNKHGGKVGVKSESSSEPWVMLLSVSNGSWQIWGWWCCTDVSEEEGWGCEREEEGGWAGQWSHWASKPDCQMSNAVKHASVGFIGEGTSERSPGRLEEVSSQHPSLDFSEVSYGGCRADSWRLCQSSAAERGGVQRVHSFMFLLHMSVCECVCGCMC